MFDKKKSSLCSDNYNDSIPAYRGEMEREGKEGGAEWVVN